MKYRKLELLLLSVGLVGILVSIITALLNGARIAELLGQALFVPVLFFALHYGRRAGYAAAVVAALLFLIIKTQALGEIDLTVQDGRLAVLQAAAFGLVGIIGGELAMRIKYVVAHITDEGLIDTRTKLFSHEYIERLLTKLWSGYKRDGRSFTMLFIELRWPEPPTDMARAKQISRIADVLRSSVRLVDEVGYLHDGRFCLILPDTSPDNASTVYARLKKTYTNSQKYFHLTAEWREEILNLPADETQIAKLIPSSEHFRVTA